MDLHVAHMHCSLRQVFSFDGVGVGLVIRSAEWYAPVKIIMVLEEKCSDIYATCHSVSYDPRRVEL